MTRSKKLDNAASQNPLSILESNSDSSDDQHFSWNSIDAVALLGLVSWVADAGGITTLGLSSSGDNLYFSVRFGDNRRSYNVVSAQQFELATKPLIEACKIVCRDRDKKPA